MRVLITGSNGLLGTALKELLGDGHVYHTRSECDLMDEKKSMEYISHHVKFSGIDTIIHCAAKVGGVQANSTNNKTFFIENYIINNNVITSSILNDIPNFVNLSSTCIFPDKNITYPLTADQIDVSEPHYSNYGYSYAKRLSGYQTKTIRQLTGNNWITIVPTNIYGPHDNFHPDHSHMIPGIIQRAYKSKLIGEDFIVWGDGSPLRQFIHSHDLSKIILWAIENWNQDLPFMAVNNQEYSVMEIVNIVTEKLSIDKSKIVFDETKPKGQFRKPAKSDVPTNYKFIDLREGIENTIDWFISNYNTIRK